MAQIPEELNLQQHRRSGSHVSLEQWIYSAKETSRLLGRAHINPADAIGDICLYEKKASLMVPLWDGRNWLSGSFSVELCIISTDSVCLQGTVQYATCFHYSIKYILNLKLPPMIMLII
jgi:hypothetical protein